MLSLAGQESKELRLGHWEENADANSGHAVAFILQVSGISRPIPLQGSES